ncbi:MAG: membrane integrity-associated transporter subunit PqiC [Rhodoblastus sp.]|nr:MAG: membrane integrity-associated transporter subunit PqiC [Rhodoblastus sp.]
MSAPVATAALDSERILVRSAPEEIAYLPGAQWGDRLPQLIQARMVQSLENAQLLASVSRTGQGVAGDWSMSGEVRRFEIDAPSGQAVVEITVKLANNAAGRIVGAMVARGAAPGSAARPEDAAAALDAALAQAMAQIVAFVRARV